MVWPAVPVDEYPGKGKSMAQTRLKPVVLDIIRDDDIKALRTPIYYRDMRMKKIERWTTHQACDQGALLSQLDPAMLLGVKEQTVTTGGCWTCQRNFFTWPGSIGGYTVCPSAIPATGKAPPPAPQPPLRLP